MPAELASVSPNSLEFAALRSAGRPGVLRGLAADWPAVAAALAGGIEAYLGELATDEPLPMVRAAHDEKGLLHYDPSLSRPNFLRTPAPLREILFAIATETRRTDGDTIAVQGVDMASSLPAFVAENRMHILPGEIAPRAWIGTPTKVAIHSDPAENLACVVAGRRRFTLFPPDQVGNLYMGPFHVTPAGTPVSMVHLTNPDFERYPRFVQALEHSQQAELGPGDAIYIPYGWYHHVESLADVNMLVNYWWNPARRDLGSPWDALMHGMMSLRQLPPDQRAAWRAMFDHYVFLSNGDPAVHLPADVRGVMAADSPEDVSRLRQALIAALRQQAATS
jgi:hypothetical protein